MQPNDNLYRAGDMTQDAKGNLFASFAHGITELPPNDGIVTHGVESDA